MIVNVINLPHRDDRRISALQQSIDQGFEIIWWLGIVETPAYTGVSKAHRQIVEHAKASGMKEVCIMEDDCVFTTPGAFDYFIKNKPEDFDLYFGMNYQGDIKSGRIVNGFSGMTLYIVKESFYDFFLSAPDSDHIDRWLGLTAFENNYLICPEYCCYQMNGFSDNRRAKSSYESYYEGKPWYKSPPPKSV